MNDEALSYATPKDLTVQVPRPECCGVTIPRVSDMSWNCAAMIRAVTISRKVVRVGRSAAPALGAVWVALFPVVLIALYSSDLRDVRVAAGLWLAGLWALYAWLGYGAHHLGVWKIFFPGRLIFLGAVTVFTLWAMLS